jgi:hypothetical protein
MTFISRNVPVYRKCIHIDPQYGWCGDPSVKYSYGASGPEMVVYGWCELHWSGPAAHHIEITLDYIPILEVMDV